MSNPRPTTLLRRVGMTLPELLVAVSITGVLLAATAVATHAAAKSYAANLARADSSGRARATLGRLVDEVRLTREHAPLTSDGLDSPRSRFARGLVVEDAGLVLFDRDGQRVGYEYDADAGTLLYCVGHTDGPASDAGQRNVLLRGVRDFAVTLEPMRSHQSLRGGGGHDLLKRATFRVRVALPDAGTETGEEFELSASSVPRRNAW